MCLWNTNVPSGNKHDKIQIIWILQFPNLNLSHFHGVGEVLIITLQDGLVDKPPFGQRDCIYFEQDEILVTYRQKVGQINKPSAACPWPFTDWAHTNKTPYLHFLCMQTTFGTHHITFVKKIFEIVHILHAIWRKSDLEFKKHRILLKQVPTTLLTYLTNLTLN